MKNSSRQEERDANDSIENGLMNSEPLHGDRIDSGHEDD